MPYITTSRKASQVSRRLARSLSNFFPGAHYENRGKRGMDSVLARARELGFTRVVLIYESHGNPGEIEFIDVGEDSWSIAGKISFTVVSVGKILRGEYSVKCNPPAEKIAGLFKDPDAVPEDGGEDEASLVLDNNYLIFSVGGKEMIRLKML
ncbi:MAG: hypothetical protein N3H30_02920 [Candidatus Micrarchaeota archaeon]|nr:hypothetical protein [Candidatus Micrarchaeota archaeon]